MLFPSCLTLFFLRSTRKFWNKNDVLTLFNFIVYTLFLFHVIESYFLTQAQSIHANWSLAVVFAVCSSSTFDQTQVMQGNNTDGFHHH